MVNYINLNIEILNCYLKYFYLFDYNERKILIELFMIN